jgi:transposase-like protein
MQLQPTSQPTQPSHGEKQCPHCGSEMRLISVMPVFSNGGLDEMTYQCRNCGGETKYMVKTR